jgi:Xaa-Pro aminopeptidase
VAGTGNRLARLRRSLAEAGLDGFLVTHPPNLRYLFGFTGSLGVAFVTGEDSILLVDSRYLEQAGQETKGCQVQLAANPLGQDLRRLLTGPGRIGVEADTLPYARALTWDSWSDSWQVYPTYGLVEQLREIKSPEEIEQIRLSCRLAIGALKEFLSELPWGTPEVEAAGRLEFLFRKLGAEGTAFDTIVATGSRSALPHARPGSRPIEPGKVLLVDFGARRDGYCSDMTRVVLPDDPRIRQVASVVEEARQAAFQEIRPGVAATRVDAAAREVIGRAGYGPYFGHGTGHGLGLEIHERPRISISGDDVLAAGMVFTIEPGIYLPGEFGIRIEDVVVVTEAGYELLSG